MEYIVKYDNRKLYSKSLNKYVNLDYLIDLVKINKGHTFKVVKYNKTKDVLQMPDITSNVLAEAITKLNINKTKLIQLIKDN